MRASVGGSPLSGPDWVPIMVHCATTYGSSTAVTCSSNRKSGKALNRPDAYGSTSEGALTVGTADSTALAKACADCAVRPSTRAVSQPAS
jgi:hypothetical protein